jgi:acetyl esterase/lipase
MALVSRLRRIAAGGLVLAAATALLCLGVAGSAGAASAHLDLDYDLDSPPAPALAGQNRLDLYLPDGAAPTDSRPVVVYVHGGAWRTGDKRYRLADKVALFTGAGYVFASLNYRLSPQTLSPTPDPSRVMFPDHPHDVGEAIGWLDRNVASFGGDPKRIALIGHSAGAHLVSLLATDPSYVEAYGVEPWQLIGAVSLDTGAFDVPARIAEVGPIGRLFYYNAFGTPAEDAATGAWAAASPITWADRADPAQLLVTQAAVPARVQENRRMAGALGQDPGAVFLAPYDHRGINDAVGAADDTAGETEAIQAFLAGAVAAAEPPLVLFRKRPPKRIETARRRAKVGFRFTSVAGASFECRLDRARWKPCGSPRSLRVGRGKHRFRVRALAPSGRPGPAATHRFAVRRR